MKRLGEYIKKCIKEEGKTSIWVADKLGINYKTFVGKLNRDSITAEELLKISVLLDINLENLKRDLNYSKASRLRGNVPISTSAK
ncbi:MAG: hypothetical protein RIN55_07680 [Tissierellaceae bacterium]|nr:hypothetical protein [Tissierellaceae bacterium]